MSRRSLVFYRVLSVLLGLLFCAAGVLKLLGGPEVAERFASWGYPDWFPRLIGLAETAGGIALLVPRMARLGSAVLFVIMVGANLTHLRAGEWSRLPFVVALCVLLYLVFRWRSRDVPPSGR